MGLFNKLFGTRSEREVKKLAPLVDAVMALEDDYRALSDEDLRAKTQEFKDRLAAGETLDQLLPEAFATVREAADRVLGMRPYRVQVVGGIVLHQGRIAEMKTGEGKTLVAILPAYLNALTGEGVHIVTVNDYLAKRDSEWMGKVYRFLGLSVGLIIHDKTPAERRASYAADITYGTNNEFGFDYLRDNMAIYKQEMVQRVLSMMDSLGLDEDTPIDAKILSGAIENAQKTVESRNYQARKSVLEYDDVMNVQRKIIYQQRQQVLDGEDLQKNVQSMMRFYVDTYVASAFGEQPHLPDRTAFFEMMSHFENICFPKGVWVATDEELQTLTRDDMAERVLALMQAAYAKKEEQYGAPAMRELERVMTLRVVDEYWMDHIDAMDDLRQGIRLRAYAQEDPVVAYKREGFEMFEAMTDAIKEEIVRRVFLVRIKTNEDIKRERVAKETGANAGGDKTVRRQPVVKKIKIGPNDPCPCGSGKKYKKCCRDKDLAAERGQNAPQN